MFGRITDKIKASRFMKQELSSVPHISCDDSVYPSDNSICELICVTFNNPELVPMQASLVKKNFRGHYNLVIADNSSSKESREHIAKLCKEGGLSYISLPANPHDTGSRSHAAALNWMLRNYISKKRPAYFGFLDHDIFPIEPFSAEDILKKQAVYGLLQERGKYWYLWAGFCFFNTSKCDLTRMDFMPGAVDGLNLDTGGKNWEPIYSKLDKNKLEFPSQTYIQLREGDVAQSDKIEIIGKWAHSFNGSYWMKVDKKEHLLEAYLKQYM